NARTDCIARDAAIPSDAGVEPGNDPDRAWVAAGITRGAVDCGPQRANLGHRSASFHDDTVGNFGRYALSDRAIACDINRYLGAEWRKAQSTMVERDNLAVEVDGLAAQQCADYINRFADCARRLFSLDTEFGKP